MQERQEATSYASFLARAAAVLLDWAIVLLLAGFISSSVSDSDANRVAIFLIVFSLYEIGFHLAIGATPGKMALRMHVAGANGERPEPDKLILRYLIFLIGLLVIVGPIVSGVMVLVDVQRRALHDRAAGTRVVYGRPGWLQDET